MLTEKQLQQFADLAVKIGANMQEGQEVVIRADVKAQEFAHLIAESAYRNGAKLVHYEWRDEEASKIGLLHAETEVLSELTSYKKEQLQYFIDHNCCLISISSGDPNIYKGLDTKKIATINKEQSQQIDFFRHATMSNLLRWTIVCIPTTAWAKTVFPKETEEVAVSKLWDAIGNAMRLNEADPVSAWATHIDNLTRRATFMTEKNFDYIHMIASNGTDLKVGLAEGHQWIAASEHGQDGVAFTANMPTEEVFTAPHNKKINGVVKSALPLISNGNIIDEFSITFKDGVVVDYSAKTGLDTLKGLLETDEGVKSLGEIALIGKNSPIALSNILYYNTLFDENASCHLAFGQSYITTVKDGNNLDKAELDRRGMNNSTQHVDFMVGTKDMKIVGVDATGSETVLFLEGDWVI